MVAQSRCNVSTFPPNKIDAFAAKFGHQNGGSWSLRAAAMCRPSLRTKSTPLRPNLRHQNGGSWSLRAAAMCRPSLRIKSTPLRPNLGTKTAEDGRSEPLPCVYLPREIYARRDLNWLYFVPRILHYGSSRLIDFLISFFFLLIISLIIASFSR